MNVSIQNSGNGNDALRQRKAHLEKLLDVVDARTGKAATVQTMTVSLIRAKIGLIDDQMRKRP